MEQINIELFLNALDGAVNHLTMAVDEVNELNVFPVPDGDTGTNMSMTVKSAKKQVNENNHQTIGEITKLASRGALMGARGNSGVILSQWLRGFADGLKGCKDTIDINTMAIALKKASETTYAAVMKPTEGTILTVAREASDFAVKNHKRYDDIIEFFNDFVHRATESLNNTPNLLPVLKEAGVVDAGGMGLLKLFEGFYAVLTGKTIASIEERTSNQPARKDHAAHDVSTGDIKYGYCTEFMVETEVDAIDELKKKLAPLGDSMLVVGDESLAKVHIHTNNPGKALEYGLEHGFLKDIKIDNMRLQHQEILFTSEEVKEAYEEEQEEQNVVKELKKYGLITISSGAGLTEVFKDLGADEIVEGGQTMNPSTEDIISAVNKINAEHIFILPNNSNIILSANQARDISKIPITVIPSKTVPEGISALLSFNEDLSASENEEEMIDAMAHTLTGEVTYAVRDTVVGDKEIKKEDFIGIYNKDILACGRDLNEVVTSLVDEMMNEDVSLCTLFYGKDVTLKDAENLQAELEDRYGDMDIEVINGEQPLYYYLISLEE